MAMNSSIKSSSFILSTKLALLITLLHLLSASSCFSSSSKHPQDSSTIRGLLFEEKIRLGSTPPSCHNRCNQCHPCMAIQVPTPSHNRVQPGLSQGGAVNPLDYYHPSAPSSSATGNKYSNYKPLGWKCRCNNHLYNP